MGAVECVGWIVGADMESAPTTRMEKSMSFRLSGANGGIYAHSRVRRSFDSLRSLRMTERDGRPVPYEG